MKEKEKKGFYKSIIYLIVYLSVQLILQIALPNDIELIKPILYLSIGLMVTSIFICAAFKFFRETGHLIPILLNGSAASFAIHAYMLHIEGEFTYPLMILILIGSVVLMLFFKILSMVDFIRNKTFLLTLLVILPFITFLLLWIFLDKTIYSQAFFAALMTIAFFIGSETEATSQISFGRRMMFASFGSVYIVIIVALIILSSGEFLEGLVPDGGDGSAFKKRRAKK